MLKNKKRRKNSTGEARDPVKGIRGLFTFGRCAGRFILVSEAKVKRFRGVTGTEAT